MSTQSGVQTNLRRRTDPNLLQCSETADAKYATWCVCVSVCECDLMSHGVKVQLHLKAVVLEQSA